MSAPGSRAKRSSSSVKGRPRSLSIASNILRSASLSSWRAASRSGVSGGDDSSGLNTAINAAAVAKVAIAASVPFFPARTTPLFSPSFFPPGTGGPFPAEGGFKGREKSLVRCSSRLFGLRRIRPIGGRRRIGEGVAVRRPQGGTVRTWVSSRWKNPCCPGQFLAEINNASR
jgi:murein DD-endopeptidase MepM/ murein hydrolase activator NlpD